MIYSLKVFIVFVVLGLPFPHVHLSVGGGGGGQQASSLSSKHKLWNFHRYSLVSIYSGTSLHTLCTFNYISHGAKVAKII